MLKTSPYTEIKCALQVVLAGIERNFKIHAIIPPVFYPVLFLEIARLDVKSPAGCGGVGRRRQHQ